MALLPALSTVADEERLATFVMGRIDVTSLVLSEVLVEALLTAIDAGVGVMVTVTVIVTNDGESIAVGMLVMLSDVVELNVLVERLLGKNIFVVRLVRELLLLFDGVVVGVVVV